MPVAYTKNGTPFLEPPYTEAEQMELYRRYNGVAAILRPARPKDAPPAS